MCTVRPNRHCRHSQSFKASIFTLHSSFLMLVLPWIPHRHQKMTAQKFSLSLSLAHSLPLYMCMSVCLCMCVKETMRVPRYCVRIKSYLSDKVNSNNVKVDVRDLICNVWLNISLVHKSMEYWIWESRESLRSCSTEPTVKKLWFKSLNPVYLTQKT